MALLVTPPAEVMAALGVAPIPASADKFASIAWPGGAAGGAVGWAEAWDCIVWASKSDRLLDAPSGAPGGAAGATACSCASTCVRLRFAGKLEAPPATPEAGAGGPVVRPS